MNRTLPILCLLLVFGCWNEEPSSSAPEAPIPTPEQPSVEVARPGVLRLEGNEQPITLYRYEDPEAPFITFLPERDLQGGTTSGDNGRTVRFVANFGGVTNPDAYAAFFFPAESLGETTGSLGNYLTGDNGLAVSNGWEVSGDVGATPCLWAVEGFVYRDQSGNAMGMMCIGEHAGQPFYLLTHVPVEMLEGFGARLDVLLDHFRWRDDNTPLSAPASEPVL